MEGRAGTWKYSRVFFDRQGALGLTLFLFLVLVAVFASHLILYNPNETIGSVLESPSTAHLMGTDSIGRDVFSHVVLGSRISLLFALGAGSIALVVGVVLGAFSGFYGGWVDDLLSRIIDVFIMIPRLFLIILVVALFGNKLILTIVIIGLTIWPPNARILRAQVLSIKSRSFVLASRAAGTRPLRTLFRHVVPNAFGPVVANSTLLMAQAVLLEASLGFLGLGDPRYPSWGQLINQGQLHIRQAWWMVVFPGAALFLLLVSLHMIGDGVSRVMNPRLRRGNHE